MIGRGRIVERVYPGYHYERLVEQAVPTVVNGSPVSVASLSDLIAMKRPAGRPKDRIELQILGGLREEGDRRD